MILDMQVDPSEYPESDSDQDQAWLTDIVKSSSAENNSALSRSENNPTVSELFNPNLCSMQAISFQNLNSQEIKSTRLTVK